MEEYLNEVNNIVIKLTPPKNLTPKNFIEFYSPYDPIYKDLVDEYFKKNSVNELTKALIDNGYTIKRTMSNKDNDASLNAIDIDDLLYTFKNNPSSGRKGIVVEKLDNKADKINVKDLPTQLKKISNILINLISSATQLYNSKFSGSSIQTNNELKELYEDIMDKAYIITRKSSSNQQIINLENQFDKLYKLVMTGINGFIPPAASVSGGNINKSINKLNSFVVYPRKIKSNFMHLL
jgi:hypothetical protein